MNKISVLRRHSRAAEHDAAREPWFCRELSMLTARASFELGNLALK
jgi:hypothetical protein